jgi:hypothetical protein
MLPKLIIAFERLNESEFLAKSARILKSIGGNSHFPEPWPSKVPAEAQLAKSFYAYQTAYSSAIAGNTSQIVIRDSARGQLTELLKKLAPFLELMADGDVSILQSTGYDLRKPPVRTNGVETLAAPEGFNLSHCNRSGMLIARIKKLTGARSYQAQITEGDPTVAANWKEAGTFPNSSRMELGGLTPGRLYSVRLCGIGSKGAGAWSSAVSIIAL